MGSFQVCFCIIYKVLLLEANLCPASVPAFIQEFSVGTEQGRSQDILLTVGLSVLGIAAANWADYGMFKSGQSSHFSAKYLFLKLFTGNPNAWRAPIALQAFFLIGALAVLHGVMGSPRQASV
jgi:hypothetical protein